MEQIAYHPGCVYLRMPRKADQKIHSPKTDFRLGKGVVLKEGKDLTIAATGFVMVPEALKTAELLSSRGIEASVIDFHTVKPLDQELLLEYAGKTGLVVTMENHQAAGGLGGAAAECLGLHLPTRLLRIGVEDRFGQVGTMEFLMDDYGLSAEKMAPRIEDYMKNGSKREWEKK